MLPLLMSAGGGAIAGGALNLLGGIFSNKSSAKQQDKANAQAQANSREQMIFQHDQNREAMDYSTRSNQIAMQFAGDQAQKQMNFQDASNAKQMDYQTQMSNTAHQREISDLKAAGLNPILSGSGGMGSSTPLGSSSSGAMAQGASSSGVTSAGSAASAGAARMENVIGPAVNSGLQIYRGLEELENTRAQTGNINQQTETGRAQGILYGAQAEAAINSMGLTNAQKEHYRALIDEIYRGKMPGYQASTKRDTASAKLSDAQRGRVPSEIGLNRASARSADSTAGLKDVEKLSAEELLKLTKQDVGLATNPSGEAANTIHRLQPIIQLINAIMGNGPRR